MHILLPYPNFVATVMCLDRGTLDEQRRLARRIQRNIQEGDGWINHQSTAIWSEHILALMLYGDCCIREWVRRGYENDMPFMLARGPDPEQLYPVNSTIPMPEWMGREDIHASHRSVLLGLDPIWYGQFGWKEKPGGDIICQ